MELTFNESFKASGWYRTLRWAFQPVKEASQLPGRWAARRTSREKIRQYLAHADFKGLHVGCGPFYLNGWLNSDLYGARSHADFHQDITQHFEFPDETLDAIYASEVIEHLPRQGCTTFLREAFRVLKPGGVLRLTTPDIAECCRLYLGQNPDAKIEQFGEVWKEGRFSPENWLNSQFMDYGHRHLFSFNELTDRLKHFGFQTIDRCQPRETTSKFDQLRSLENRYGKNAPTWLWSRTMVVDATK